MNYNRLKIEIFDAYDDALVVDVGNELRLAMGLKFGTIYPGGLYSTCSFFIPRDATAGWQFQGGQRLVIRNGLTIVWEGAIADDGPDFGSGADQGKRINGLGYWGWLLGFRGVKKSWADVRVDEGAWVLQTGTTGDGEDQVTLDRLNRICFTPKAVAWANGDYAAVRYAMGPGQTVKRLVYSYDFAEPAGTWEISAWRSTDGSAFTQMTAGSGETYGTGTTTVITATAGGVVDVTLATPSRYIELRYYSRAAQTPVADGTFHGEFSSLTVYSETGSINGQEVAKDIRAMVSELNSDETRIGALTLSLVPLSILRYTMFTEWLTHITSFGDASFNPWAAFVDHSETATTPDGKPVLVLEQYPALTDYDYAIRLDEENLTPTFSILKNYVDVHNWIVVEYIDLLGRSVKITPDDNANLKDDTSIAMPWGRREFVLSVGDVSSTVAVNLGRRYLAAHKDPQFYVSGPVQVTGAIRGKNGNIIPASEVKSGMRLRIEDFISDEASVAGAGLTFLITQTDYDDTSETVSISTGTPDHLPTMLAQIAAFGAGNVL